MEQATQLRMCFTCCTEKPEGEFGRSKPNTCKECIRVKARRRYQEDPAIRDRMRSASSARWHANREELAARARADQAERRAAAMERAGLEHIAQHPDVYYPHLV